ncbi:hypothetical protein Mboo_0742 [Methanoregula boonei 6A8]|uniref:Uncharacterized protein n=1 Tax=Methanoregula boonei (strain DSM 21154 / JCM 14090 / 6A8) TaxID=456442 RepID=A7I699_METB6|nr:hypothetical protein Mboo_0742 [Methanoregula boonei 6A8]
MTHFLESSARDPLFFYNLQLLSDTFSGIVSLRHALFLKSSAADAIFFLHKRRVRTGSDGDFEDYSWFGKFCCGTASIFFENLQLLSRSFSGILSSGPVLFWKSAGRGPAIPEKELPGRYLFLKSSPPFQNFLKKIHTPSSDYSGKFQIIVQNQRGLPYYDHKRESLAKFVDRTYPSPAHFGIRKK